MLKKTISALSVSALLLTPLCASKEEAKTSPEAQKKIDEMKKAFGSLNIDLKTVKPDTVVARVGDKSFTAEDVAKVMQKTGRAIAQNMGPELAKTLTPEILFLLAREQAVDFYLLQQDVKKNETRLMKDPEVQESLEEAKKAVLQNALLKEYVDKYVTNAKVREKYVEFSKEFPKDAEEVRLRMIVLKTEPEAKEVIKKLNAGADFLKLAREESIDKKTAEKDGELGYISSMTVKHFPPEFGVVFEKSGSTYKIPAGRVTETPIKTPLGYVVLKVEDRRPLKMPKLSEIEPVIKQVLQREAAQKFQEQLKKGMDIKRFNPNTGKPMKSLDEELKAIQEKVQKTTEKNELVDATKELPK